MKLQVHGKAASASKVEPIHLLYLQDFIFTSPGFPVFDLHRHQQGNAILNLPLFSLSGVGHLVVLLISTRELWQAKKVIYKLCPGAP